jgi:hypothetical protein
MRTSDPKKPRDRGVGPFNRLRSFLSLISRSRVAIAGAVLVTTAVLADAIIIVSEVFFFESNPYIGIVVWVLFPMLAMFGLVLIPFGLWWRARSKGVRGLSGLAGLMKVVNRRHFFQMILGLSFLNLIIFGTAGYQALHYMESPQFCGSVCHTVMEPEYRVYKRSPHSEVECVDCHIGSGLGHLIKSKLDGTRQLWGVISGDFNRPIQTPIHNLRPAREVCGTCHFPESFHGNTIRVIENYAPDQDNTRTVTILNMRVGGGTGPNKKASGIHWHVDKGSAIRYYASDSKREKILRVEHRKDDGTVRVWNNSEIPMPEEPNPEGFREMDCVDCHNRPTHIFLPPEKALDQWFTDGLLDVEIPWLRAIGEDLIDVTYSSKAEAMEGIATLPDLYRERYPQFWDEFGTRVTASVSVLQDIYGLYVYPEMNLQWNTYNSLLGHPTEFTAACFRCHNGIMKDENGKAITTECTACHYVLADKEKDPMIFRILEDR